MDKKILIGGAVTTIFALSSAFVVLDVSPIDIINDLSGGIFYSIDDDSIDAGGELLDEFGLTGSDGVGEFRVGSGEYISPVEGAVVTDQYGIPVIDQNGKRSFYKLIPVPIRVYNDAAIEGVCDMRISFDIKNIVGASLVDMNSVGGVQHGYYDYDLRQYVVFPSISEGGVPIENSLVMKKTTKDPSFFASIVLDEPTALNRAGQEIYFEDGEAYAYFNFYVQWLEGTKHVWFEIDYTSVSFRNVYSDELDFKDAVNIGDGYVELGYPDTPATTTLATTTTIPTAAATSTTSTTRTTLPTMATITTATTTTTSTAPSTSTTTYIAPLPSLATTTQTTSAATTRATAATTLPTTTATTTTTTTTTTATTTTRPTAVAGASTSRPTANGGSDATSPQTGERGNTPAVAMMLISGLICAIMKAPWIKRAKK